MSKNWPKHNSGFTLLEIMIALSILAIIFTSIFGVYSQVLDVAENVDKQGEFSQIGYRAITQIADDLDSIYVPQNNNTESSNSSEEQNKFVFQGKSPSEYIDDNATLLRFSTTASLGFNSTFPDHQINEVKYILQKTQKETFQLLRQETPMHYISGKKSFRITLCPNIKEMEILFHSADRSNPASSWNQGYTDKKEKLPTAVELTITMSTGDKREKIFRLMRTTNRL